MHASAATRANRALWSHYLQHQWGPLFAPLGGDAAAALFGDAVALWYEAAWGGFIDRLFAGNAQAVTRFVQESGADVRPTPQRAPPPEDPRESLDTPPPWLRAVVDIYHPHDDAPVRSRERQPVA